MRHQGTQALKLAKKNRQAAKMVERARLEKEQESQNKEEESSFRPARMLSFLDGKRKFDKKEILGSRRQTASFPRRYKAALVTVYVPDRDPSSDKKPEFFPELAHKIRTRKMIGNSNGVRKYELSIKDIWIRKPTDRMLGKDLRLVHDSVRPLQRSKTSLRRLTAKLVREELAVLEDIATGQPKSEIEEQIDADHVEAIEIENVRYWRECQRQGRGSQQVNLGKSPRLDDPCRDEYHPETRDLVDW